MIICLKWCWISLLCEVLYAYSYCPASLKLSPWGKDHAVCLVYLLVQQVPVQHHLRYFIQPCGVQLKQGSPECFLIPGNTMALWPSSASFSVTFPSPLHFSLLFWVAAPIISAALRTRSARGCCPQAGWWSANSIVPTSSPRTSFSRVLLCLMHRVNK